MEGGGAANQGGEEAIKKSGTNEKALATTWLRVG
jgi:hypothetical protein